MVFSWKALTSILIMHISWNVIIELGNMSCMWNVSIYWVITVGIILLHTEKYRCKEWYIYKSINQNTNVVFKRSHLSLTNQIKLNLWYCSLTSNSGFLLFGGGCHLPLNAQKKLENILNPWGPRHIQLPHPTVGWQGKPWDLISWPCHHFWRLCGVAIGNSPYCVRPRGQQSAMMQIILVLQVTSVNSWLIQS